MLHRRNPNFDPVKFLEGIVQILKEQKLKVVTYQEISAHPDITATEQGRLFIITIEDVSLQAEIDPSIKQMIAIMRDAGYTAVLGVVTEGKGTNEETVRILKELSEQGWEIAMHTDRHVDLHELEKVSMYGARQEIQVCRKKIIDAIGVHPITLVLPYGDMVENLKIMYRENIVWAVGIVGGEKYRTTNYVYYVGRESPDGDPQTTFRNMMKRFNGQ
jgi:peptidoglycan/xylan/chitin deacetylase (PgdA/CDA1 family)